MQNTAQTGSDCSESTLGSEPENAQIGAACCAFSCGGRCRQDTLYAPRMAHPACTITRPLVVDTADAGSGSFTHAGTDHSAGAATSSDDAGCTTRAGETQSLSGVSYTWGTAAGSCERDTTSCFAPDIKEEWQAPRPTSPSPRPAHCLPCKTILSPVHQTFALLSCLTKRPALCHLGLVRSFAWGHPLSAYPIIPLPDGTRESRWAFPSGVTGNPSLSLWITRVSSLQGRVGFELDGGAIQAFLQIHMLVEKLGIRPDSVVGKRDGLGVCRALSNARRCADDGWSGLAVVAHKRSSSYWVADDMSIATLSTRPSPVLCLAVCTRLGQLPFLGVVEGACRWASARVSLQKGGPRGFGTTPAHEWEEGWLVELLPLHAYRRRRNRMGGWDKVEDAIEVGSDWLLGQLTQETQRGAAAQVLGASARAVVVTSLLAAE
eukprot:gb/GEZN01007122.1/.p1 GENE.gb/GEZN01007122.1/~~gb/GEZN01007122.1/.p1  ORF type:complete len:434 (+),score=16.95 gb/GEZN01007122.1/:133-1434(+)